MKSIDITKIEPTNWKYILGLILVIIIVLGSIFVGTWAFNAFKGLATRTSTTETDVI